jgi:hypothetical protein
LRLDGVEYELRGFHAAAYPEGNSFSLYFDAESERDLLKALNEASTIEIKYEKKNGDSRQQITDIFELLAPDFDYIPVEKREQSQDHMRGDGNGEASCLSILLLVRPAWALSIG